MVSRWRSSVNLHNWNTLADHWKATGRPLEAHWLPTILSPVAFQCTLGSKFQAHWIATGLPVEDHWLRLRVPKCHNWPRLKIPKDFRYHDDVIEWKHFPRYWLFVRGIHRSRWSPRTKPMTRSFDVFFDVRPTLSWSLRCHCNVFVVDKTLVKTTSGSPCHCTSA